MDRIEFNQVQIYPGTISKFLKLNSNDILFWNNAQSFSIDCEFNNGVGWSVFKPLFSKLLQIKVFTVFYSIYLVPFYEGYILDRCNSGPILSLGGVLSFVAVAHNSTH